MERWYNYFAESDRKNLSEIEMISGEGRAARESENLLRISVLYIEKHLRIVDLFSSYDDTSGASTELTSLDWSSVISSLALILFRAINLRNLT